MAGIFSWHYIWQIRHQAKLVESNLVVDKAIFYLSQTSHSTLPSSETDDSRGWIQECRSSGRVIDIEESLH